MYYNSEDTEWAVYDVERHHGYGDAEGFIFGLIAGRIVGGMIKRWRARSR